MIWPRAGSSGGRAPEEIFEAVAIRTPTPPQYGPEFTLSSYHTHRNRNSLASLLRGGGRRRFGSRFLVRAVGLHGEFEVGGVPVGFTVGSRPERRGKGHMR